MDEWLTDELSGKKFLNNSVRSPWVHMSLDLYIEVAPSETRLELKHNPLVNYLTGCKQREQSKHLEEQTNFAQSSFLFEKMVSMEVLKNC